MFLFYYPWSRSEVTWVVGQRYRNKEPKDSTHDVSNCHEFIYMFTMCDCSSLVMLVAYTSLVFQRKWNMLAMSDRVWRCLHSIHSGRHSLWIYGVNSWSILSVLKETKMCFESRNILYFLTGFIINSDLP